MFVVHDTGLFTVSINLPEMKKARYTTPMLSAKAARTNPPPIKHPPMIATILCEVRLMRSLPRGAAK